MSLESAAALLHPVDSLAIPLGPGQPGALLHVLSARDDFEDLQVFGALLLDFYPLFAQKGVRLLSGFFGPAERALRAAGHDVQFVPGDFRRFATVAEQLAPRVMTTAVAPAGPDGRFSLSLHAGATLDALRACGRDPGRVLIAEVNRELPFTFGLPPEHTHDLGPEEIDVLVEGDRPPERWKIRRRARSRSRSRATSRSGSRRAPHSRPASGASRAPSRPCWQRAAAETTGSTARCSRRA